MQAHTFRSLVFVVFMCPSEVQHGAGGMAVTLGHGTALSEISLSDNKRLIALNTQREACVE